MRHRIWQMKNVPSKRKVKQNVERASEKKKNEQKNDNGVKKKMKLKFHLLWRMICTSRPHPFLGQFQFAFE